MPTTTIKLASAPRPSASFRFGLLQAADDATRSTRLSTLAAVQRLEPLPADEQIAASWALLRRRLRRAGLRMEVNESWIAATSMARHGDRHAGPRLPDLTVIRV